MSQASPFKYTTMTAIRVLIATIVPQFAFGLSFVWVALAPYTIQQSQWQPVVNSAIYALTPLSSAITFLFAGRLATLIPPRRLCWIGMSLLVAGLAVAFLFPNQFTFLLFYAMLALGVGYGIMLAAALAIVSQVFPKRLGTIGGALTAAYALAAVAEVPIVSSLAVTYSWIEALRIVGSIVTLLAVLSLLLLPAFSMPREQQKELIPFSLLKHPRVVTAIFLPILGVPLGSYAVSQVGIYAQELRFTTVLAATAVTMVALGNMLGRFIGGFASDHVSVNRVILIIVVIDGVAGILLWRASGEVVLLVAAGLAGLACGGLAGTVPRLATDTLPTALNAVSGLLFAAFSLGGFIGPMLGSALGGGRLSWFVLSLFSLFSIALIIIRIMRVPGRISKDTQVSTFLHEPHSKNV